MRVQQPDLLSFRFTSLGLICLLFFWLFVYPVPKMNFATESIEMVINYCLSNMYTLTKYCLKYIAQISAFFSSSILTSLSLLL